MNMRFGNYFNRPFIKQSNNSQHFSGKKGNKQR